MKNFLFALIICISAVSSVEAQTEPAIAVVFATPTQNNTPTSDAPEVKVAVSRLASFPGGVKAIAAYLQENLNYPMEARENAIEGQVMVRVEINAMGGIKAVEVLSGIGFGCDEEAVRVIAAMPAWLPAMQMGRMIKSKVVLPINFRLANK